MIPNWLLGKSKSKLQEILGGGGGGGTTYTAGEGIDITDHEISVDPLLMNDIEQTALAIPTKAAKTQITNPNILHNSWFQVNQRKFTTGNTNGYCVDRWRALKATTGDTTYTLNSDGTLTIDNSLGETQAYLIQRRTAKTISRIAGRKITASVMLSDGTVRSGSGIYDATKTTDYYVDDDIAIQSTAQNMGQFFILFVKAGKTITIKALKLELGEISTLAMDTAPDMALELAKCQRYYQRLTGRENFLLGTAFVDNATRMDLAIATPALIRDTTPTVTLTGSLKIGFSTFTTVSGIALIGMFSNILSLNLTSENMTPGTVKRISWGADSYIEINAEL